MNGNIDKLPINMPLDELGLSIRAYNSLRRSGIHTIIDLLYLTDEELLSCRNFGKKTLIEVRETLRTFFGGTKYKSLIDNLIPTYKKYDHLPKSIHDQLETIFSGMPIFENFDNKPQLSDCPTTQKTLYTQSGYLSLANEIEVLRLTLHQIKALKAQDIYFVYQLSIVPWKNAASLTKDEIDGIVQTYSEFQKKQPPFSIDKFEDRIEDIANLSLSQRTYFSLLKKGIISVHQLVKLSPEKLLDIRGLGQKSVDEIGNKLMGFLQFHKLPILSEELIETIEQISINTDLLPAIDGIDLDKIPVSRLGIDHEILNKLSTVNIESIKDLLDYGFYAWNKNLYSTVEKYLHWIGKQPQEAIHSEITNRGINKFQFDLIKDKALKDIIEELFQSAGLSSRERRILEWRFGLYSEKLTLEETGIKVGVTRERIRQIERLCLNKLKRSRISQSVRSYQLFIEDILYTNGGLINLSRMLEFISPNLNIDGISPEGVVKLFVELNENITNMHKKNIYGFEGINKDSVKTVINMGIDLLKMEHAPVNFNQTISQIANSLCDKNGDNLYEPAFIRSCLDSSPDIKIIDNSIGLTRWDKSRIDEIILALRNLGEPSHFEAIANKTNMLLDAEQKTSAHNMHVQIQRLDEIFIRVGRGIYGLAEWGLQDDGNIANAAYRVLSEQGQILSLKRLASLVLETWIVDPSSVHAAIELDERIVRFGSKRYGLQEWNLGEEDFPQENNVEDNLVSWINEWITD